MSGKESQLPKRQEYKPEGRNTPNRRFIAACFPGIDDWDRWSQEISDPIDTDILIASYETGRSLGYRSNELLQVGKRYFFGREKAADIQRDLPQVPVPATINFLRDLAVLTRPDIATKSKIVPNQLQFRRALRTLGFET